MLTYSSELIMLQLNELLFVHYVHYIFLNHLFILYNQHSPIRDKLRYFT